MQIRVISSPLVDCVLHSLACISPSAEFIFSVRSCRSLARLLASSKLVVCSVGRSNPRVGAWDAPTQWVGAWDAPTQGLERGTLQPNGLERGTLQPKGWSVGRSNPMQPEGTLNLKPSTLNLKP